MSRSLFDISSEKLNDYKRSYRGMTKRKEALERSLKRNELDIRKRDQMTYRIELINVIQGYMAAVIGDRRHINCKLKGGPMKR